MKNLSLDVLSSPTWNRISHAVGDHDRDDTTGKVLRQGLGEDKEYVARKMVSTCAYLRAYGGGGGGATAPLVPHSFALEAGDYSLKWPMSKLTISCITRDLPSK